jgi:hypothetical protein
MPLQIILLDIPILRPLVNLPTELSVRHVVHRQLVLQSVLDVLQLILELDGEGCMDGRVPSQGRW